MEQTASIGELGVPTATRPRGQEACRRLRERWPVGPLALHLDGVPLLSLSFLDELVVCLVRSGDATRIVFVTDQPRTREKLGRVAALRPEAIIFVRASRATVPDRVAPEPFDPQGPVVEEPKAETG